MKHEEVEVKVEVSDQQTQTSWPKESQQQKRDLLIDSVGSSNDAKRSSELSEAHLQAIKDLQTSQMFLKQMEKQFM